ncbi:hypothetical protein D869_gp092 [Caulobacter phage CcrRogue]|nr:hypothetical protein D869_gp009 [Caulobacter phage CcrRogue]YP_006989369.1 hypothetical protein D869_gp092 [Caulobacter phage CcrRogue]AFU86491.1 hypothetical protein CcrRogue_gp009 [Caulobacter phage CcrRogue]AFU86822.1 hypothetical protein CcrRogue_gp340 [Caulobacter phage CcrRogue]
MPEFVLDTSGQVAPPAAAKLWPHPLAWNQLSDFAQGYIEALFFTESSPAYDRAEWFGAECQEALTEGTADGNIPGDVGFSDLAPDTLNRILNDCANFKREHADTLAKAYDHGGAAGDYDETQAGRDYWYTRNGHGVGFWDRGLGEIGEALSKAARYSEQNASFEEDGKVYLF